MELKKPEPGTIAQSLLDRWDQFSDRTKKKLIANAKAPAKKAKAPRRPAPAKFDAEREEARARQAKRIHKWLDGGGWKIPATPAGIKQHKALVAKYEKEFGPSSDTDRKARERTYKAILDGLEREKTRRVQQAQRSKVVASEQKVSDAERRARQRAARKRRNAKRASGDAASDRRSRQRKVRYCRSRIRLSVRRIANSEQDVHSDEWLELYRGTSSYESVVKANDRAKELLAIFRGNLADYKARLAALQD